jgi:hypothetical protein
MQKISFSADYPGLILDPPSFLFNGRWSSFTGTKWSGLDLTGYLHVASRLPLHAFMARTGTNLPLIFTFLGCWRETLASRYIWVLLCGQSAPGIVRVDSGTFSTLHGAPV